MSGLAELANRLRRVASGADRPAALAAAAAAMNGPVEAATAAHVRTGTLHAETRVRVTGAGVVLEGPRYLPFVRGLEIAHGLPEPVKAAGRDAYVEVLRRSLGGV